MESLQVNRDKLMTQAEYAKKIGVTRAAVSLMVKEKRVPFIEIKGAKLIYLP
jgi:DNA-binding XRE family transcriptional regulator